MRGGKDPIFQQRSLYKALRVIKQFNYISEAEYHSLNLAYDFLRKLENSIQMLRDQQIHTLPVSDSDRNRLCLAMGFGSWLDLPMN